MLQAVPGHCLGPRKHPGPANCGELTAGSPASASASASGLFVHWEQGGISLLCPDRPGIREPDEEGAQDSLGK